MDLGNAADAAFLFCKKYAPLLRLTEKTLKIMPQHDRKE